MIAFRLSKAKYSSDLSGKGAEKSGGRWNSKGVPMLYTSQSRALCMAEVAVHIPFGIVPSDYQVVTIEIPDHLKIEEQDISKMPSDWKSLPPSGSTQRIGDLFILENKFIALKVPSVIVQGDFNFLINPLHKDISLIKIVSTEPFEFDKRMFLK